MSIPLDPRRRFTSQERTALYLDTEGTCAECGVELEPSWHADHVVAHARGGRTEIGNGQPLCPTCNLIKGASPVHYRDTFNPRPFQEELMQVVKQRMVAGHQVTVALASPGSGKTPGYQSIAVELLRCDDIDFVAIFAPRIILARQAELSYLRKCEEQHAHTPKCVGLHACFDERARLSKISHVPNRRPLTGPTDHGMGIVTTYAALVTNPAIYFEWAQKHAKRFLLVADEAQFCGSSDDEKGGGTKAGALVETMAGYAAHTLLLTGTPYRSDKTPLILAEYGEPEEGGRRRLDCHVRATYEDGVRERYLREFESTIIDARMRIRTEYEDGTTTRMDVDLSRYEKRLQDVLRKPEVWQPLTDRVVSSVREKKATDAAYRGLISCMEQKDARAVVTYLKRTHPDLRTVVAVSDDGKEAEEALRSFQAGHGDILVTVRKAFIGYDCPEITVVGVLTHYRDPGHLMQLVGRGLRLWNKTGTDPAEPFGQSCRIICPDDRKMTDFIDTLIKERDAGLAARGEAKEGPNPDGPGGEEPPEPGEVVEAAWATTVRAVSNNEVVDPDDLPLIEAAKRHLGINEDVTKLAQFISLMGVGKPEQMTLIEAPLIEIPPAPAKTEREQIDEYASRATKAVTAAAARLAPPRTPGYQTAMRELNSRVAKRAGLWAKDVRTIEQAQRRYEAAKAVAEEVADAYA